LVHAVLATVDLDADRAAVEGAARLQARLLRALPAEVDAAVTAVVGALEHPVVRRAAAAMHGGHCRRESPVAVVLEDGTIAEGVVDAAFYEDEPAPLWTVVDFKTDVEITSRLDEYRRQVRLYGQAIATATGIPARGVLLQV
jgi:ATP-dependent exoDNAse (exonuclease V) beta subunit